MPLALLLCFSLLRPVDEVGSISCGNFECYLCAFDDRDVVLHVSDWDIEGHGEAIGCHHIGDHVVHVLIGCVGMVFGELSHHKTSQRWQYARYAQLVHDTFYLIDRFGNIFDEEYAVAAQQVEPSVQHVGKDGEVASVKCATGYARAVVARVGGESYRVATPLQQVEESCVVLVVRPTAYCIGHRSVDGGYAVAHHQGV